MMKFRLVVLAFFVLPGLPLVATADQLLPFHDPVYKDEKGHFTVTVPLGAKPCILSEDDWEGGRKTLLLIFGSSSPCAKPWEFRPPTSISTEWYRHFPNNTVISLTATANRRLNRGDELEWTPQNVALSNCLAGAGNRNRDEDSPFTFAGLPGAACIVKGHNNWSQWIGTFQRPWIDPTDADRDKRGRILPWVEYTVELYGPDAGFKRHHRTLEQVLKSVTLIPATPDAARHW